MMRNRFLLEIRFAVRAVLVKPAMPLLVVGSLALAIAASTAVFVLAEAFLFRPLPVPNPSRLVCVFTTLSHPKDYGGMSYPDYLAYREPSHNFSGLAGYTPQPVVVTYRGVSHRLWAGLATRNFFTVLGIRPEAGRFFDPAVTAGQPAAAAVFSPAAAERVFGSESPFTGGNLFANDYPMEVIGIAPRAFRGIEFSYAIDVWLPIDALPSLGIGGDALTNRGTRLLRFAIGRLRDDATITGATDELGSVATEIQRAFPETSKDRTVNMTPAAYVPTPRTRSFLLSALLPLVAAASAILAVALLNLGSLLMARVAETRISTGIRLAIGATRRDILTHYLAMASLIGIGAAVGGQLLTGWLQHLITSALPAWEAPMNLDFSINGVVLAILFAIEVAIVLILGLVPALQTSDLEVGRMLRDDGTSTFARRGWGWRIAAVLQVSFTTVLLAVSAFCIASLVRARHADLGFDHNNVLSMSVDLARAHYNADRAPALYSLLLSHLSQVPGVTHVAITQHMPFGFGARGSKVTVSGSTVSDPMRATFAGVSPGFFSTLRVSLLRGRLLDDRDVERRARAAIINEAAARKFWNSVNPIGQYLSLPVAKLEGIEVVGIVKSVRYLDLDGPIEPYIYLPITTAFRPQITAVVRLAAPQSRMGEQTRAAIQKVDGALAPYDVQYADTLVESRVWAVKLIGTLACVYSIAAVIICIVGLYSSMQRSISLRSREIAVCRALGCSNVRLAYRVLKSVLVQTAAGLVIGVILAVVLAASTLSSFLFQLPAATWWIYAIAVVAVGAATFLGCLLPVRRAFDLELAPTLRSL
jgi:predicted permease